MTLIGTLFNIIVVIYRADIIVEFFCMFDFMFVGGGIVFVGILFLVVVGWYLVPKVRRVKKVTEDLFEIAGYVVEVRVLRVFKVVGMMVFEVEEVMGDYELLVIGFVCRKRRIFVLAW